MASKFQFITELYRSTLAGLTYSHESWTGFLRSACYNYKCSFDEQVLIYAQRPNATAVLELEKWNRQFGRWVNAGAAGIAVIAESRGKGRLKHYFDITDTHATPISRPVPIWSMTPAYAGRVTETLEATFGALSEKDTLPDAVRSASRNAVADNFQDYLRDLRDCRDGSMLEELDELNVEVAYRRALESSVAYMLLTRLSLPAAAYILPEDFADIYSFDTPSTINALGIATSDIAEMGLREISRTVMQAQREQFFAKDTQIGYDAVKEQNHTEKERSDDHGSDLSDAGGLSPAQPDAAAGAVGASGQVRGAAEAVPEAASPGAVYQSQDQRPAGGASGGDRGDGAADDDADRGADRTGGGRDGGAEGRRSPALDGADEQPPAQRGGDGAERSDLQLTAKAGSDELPAFADHSGEYALLDRLRTDCDYFLGAGARNEKHLWAGSVYAQIKKMRELYAALPEKPEWLTTAAIDRYAAQMAAPYRVTTYHHFENGFDDKLDYQTLAEAEAAAQGYVDGTMDEDGFAYDGAAVYNLDTRQHLRIYGNYPDEKAQEQAAAFARAQDGLADDAALPALLDTHLIEANLLDDGGRKHKRQEIFQYFQAHKSLAERTGFLKNSYNDTWVEVLTDGVRTGYHAEQDGLLMWEGSYLSRTAESVFSWGVVTEMTESLIERGAYKIRLGLQDVPVMAEQMSFFGMADNTAVYEVPEEQRVGELFPARQVPQEVIDQALYTAGNSYGSAERIAVFYMRQWPEADCTAFLRREFGTDNGRGIEYEGHKYAVWFMEDGIHLAQGSSVRTGYSKTVVTWEQASARILALLEAGTYLSAAELEQARELVLLEMGDALLMTARDLSEEGRAAGFFPKTREIHDQHKGYPKLDKDMVTMAKSDGGLAALAKEYHAFLSAYEQDRSILRFRVSDYNTHRIGLVLDGLDLPERSFTAQPDFVRRCKMFITQDEIDRFFLADATESRLGVYAFFCHPHTKEEQQKFIKSRFGEYSGGGRDGYDYTKTYKGLTYQREYAGKQYQHQRNLNILVVGGSGSGKTRYFCKPGIMSVNCSYLVIDPKGEMLRSTGRLLEEEKYDIKVFDLIHPRQSDGYNPFTYIRDEPDVLKLMDNLVKNTTPPKGASNDPFWEKAEIALDSALMLYLLSEAPKEEQTFEMLMFMLECARVMEEDEQYQSPLDLLFQALEERDPDHVAVREYKVYKHAAGKTAKSILVTASVRLAAFIFPQYAAMMQTDEMDFASLGERKRAIFCVIPVNDGSMNYLVSMLLTQCFQQLYLRADERYNGRLPVPVRVIQDEWANVAQPDSYPKVLATCRSYNIGIDIIVQNIQSIKARYRDECQSIIGNCDTLLFLGGGNEPESLEFMSKLLGKETISIRTRGQTRGRSGSSSINFQQTGRDLMTPDEIRMLPTNDALLFIRGEKPVRDKKYDIKKHPNVRRTADGRAKPYIHNPPVPDYTLPDLPYEFHTLDDYTFLESCK